MDWVFRPRVNILYLPGISTQALNAFYPSKPFPAQPLLLALSSLQAPLLCAALNCSPAAPARSHHITLTAIFGSAFTSTAL